MVIFTRRNKRCIYFSDTFGIYCARRKIIKNDNFVKKEKTSCSVFLLFSSICMNAIRMDDSQLIQACKKQDRSAQKELYEKYAPKMMAVCLRYCGDAETSKDLLHDGFIQAYMHISSYTGRGSFEGWLRRIFVNLAIENYRLQKKKIDMAADIEQLESDVFTTTGSEYYIGDISQQMLLEMIRELPQGYRTVFNLFVFEDMSHRDIAKLMGINETASRSQYSRAKAILRNKINAVLKKVNRKQ